MIMMILFTIHYHVSGIVQETEQHWQCQVGKTYYKHYQLFTKHSTRLLKHLMYIISQPLCTVDGTLPTSHVRKLRLVKVKWLACDRSLRKRLSRRENQVHLCQVPSDVFVSLQVLSGLEGKLTVRSHRGLDSEPRCEIAEVRRAADTGWHS